MSVKRNEKRVLKKKTFDLDDLQKIKDKHYNENVAFKPQEWLKITPNIKDKGIDIFKDILGFPGFPLGHTVTVYGLKDTGKTVSMITVAKACQERGDILPVLLITEPKWSWEHARELGLQFEEVIDEDTGEVVNYKGFFLYIDGYSVKSIEGLAKEINTLLDRQKKGELPVNLMFLWDSIGTLPSQMSLDSKKVNNEWDAGAISQQFKKYILPELSYSRKETSEYTNSMLAIAQGSKIKPEVYGELTKLVPVGGETFQYMSSLLIQFGRDTRSGIKRLKAVKNKKEITYAIRTKVKIEKNHINGVDTNSKIVITPHGFIADSEGDKIAKEYFKENVEYFLSKINETGDDGIEFTEEEDGEKESNE